MEKEAWRETVTCPGHPAWWAGAAWLCSSFKGWGGFQEEPGLLTSLGKGGAPLKLWPQDPAGWSHKLSHLMVPSVQVLSRPLQEPHWPQPLLMTALGLGEMPWGTQLGSGRTGIHAALSDSILVPFPSLLLFLSSPPGKTPLWPP